jgi:TRAP-type C4-dicarboxylate transport system permease small subunit
MGKSLDRFTTYTLIFLLSIILLSSLGGMLLRLFNLNLIWLDPLVRHLVLVCLFLGGSLALGSWQHIQIDLLKNFLRKRPSLSRVLETIILILVVIGLILLTWSGLNFFLMERKFGQPDFLSIHSSWLVFIIPFGFCYMSLRALLKFIPGKEN